MTCAAAPETPTEEPAAAEPAVGINNTIPYPQYSNSGALYLKSLPGAVEPLGLFDPWGASTVATVDEVKRFREAEIMHCRLSMLAAVGWLFGEETYVENNPLFNGAVSGPALRQFQQVEAEGGYFWEVLILLIACCEFYRGLMAYNPPEQAGRRTMENSMLFKADYSPGDLGFDPLGLAPEDPEEFRAMQNKELNNGRLAMIAVAGMAAQEEIDGLKIFEHLGEKSWDDIFT